MKASNGAEIVLLTPDGQLIDSTNPQILDDIQSEEIISTAQNHTIASVGDAYYEAFPITVQDLDGRVLATAMSLEDVTAAHMVEKQMIWLMIAVMGSMMVIFLAIMLIWLRQQFKPLSRAITVLKELSRGNYDIAVESNVHKDEISSILKAIALLKEDLSEMERECQIICVSGLAMRFQI